MAYDAIVKIPTLMPRPFEPAVEDDYRSYRIAQIVPFERLASLAGAISITATYFWDAQVDGGASAETLMIRLVMAAIFLTLLGVTYTPIGKRHLLTQLVATATVFSGFSWVLATLNDGFIVGVAGLTVSMVLLPLLSINMRSMVAFGTMAVVIPNLFLRYVATPPTADFTYLNLNLWLGVAVALSVLFWMLLDAGNRSLFLAERNLASERERSDRLLLNILPTAIAERLKVSDDPVSDRFDSVSVLFADIVGFTSYAQNREPRQVVELLNALFSRFDDLVGDHGLEKIKTLGDGYMAAAGVPTVLEDHAERAAMTGLAMMDTVREFRTEMGVDWDLRIGIHSGSVVAGVIGKHKFAYDLWGDTVNVASRLESGGVPGRIQISGDTADRLPASYRLEARGTVDIRNRGPLDTHFLLERSEEPGEQ